MASTKITDLANLVTVTNTASPLTIVDLDEASPADQNKKLTYANLVTNLIASGLGGGASYTATELSSAVDVTLTPGVSDNRQFISPVGGSINVIVLTAGATNTTYFEVMNNDPGTGDIDIKIDLVGNPTEVTLDGTLQWVKIAYSGSQYFIYS